MVSEFSNLSYKEMEESNGDGLQRSPFDIPTTLTAQRTQDSGYSGRSNPFDLPSQQTTGGDNRQPVQTQPSGGVWRPPYGGVAPSAIDATSPQQTQTGGTGGVWRSPYGGVAPSAIDATNPNRQQQNPNNTQWRPDFNNPAPGARDLPPMTDPNANGGITTPGDPGRWQPSPNQIGPGVGPGGVGDVNGGMPRTANGSDPLPTVGNGGIGPPTAEQQKNIDNSLHTRMNYLTHFIEGGIGGVLGSSVIPWAGDKLAWRQGLDGNPVAEWWRRSHSPLGLQLRTVDGSIQQLESANAALVEPLQAAQAQYREAMRDMIGVKANPTAGTGASGLRLLQDMQRTANAEYTADPVANAAQGKKALLLDDLLKSRPATEAERAMLKGRIDAARMPSDTAPMTETSYLTATEAQMLNQQLGKYKTVLERHDAVSTISGEIKGTEAEIAAAQAARQAIRDRGGDFNALGTQKTWKDNIPEGTSGIKKELSTWKGDEGPLGKGRAFAEGVGVVSAGLAANYLVDKYMPNMFGLVGGHDAQAGDHWRSYLQGPVITAALLAPGKTATWKISAAVAGTVGLGVLEHMFPEKNTGTYSKIMQPNWIDSVGMGAAWMLPFASWKNRAIAVGTMYAAARGADFLNNVVGVHIPGIGDQNFAVGMQDDVASAIASKKVSADNFNSIEKSSFKLGMENEGALLGNLGKFLNDNTQDPLYHLHGSAALFTALGDVYTERGTKIDPKQLNDKGRILAGTGYDLGGQAAGFYRQAVANLVEGQNQALRTNNSDAANAMKESQQEVMKRLEKIYGQHDIGDVFNKLKTAYTQDISGIAHYQVALAAQVKGLQTRDTQYAAKMCRDMALLDLAIAAVKAEKNEGGGAQIMYAEAVQFLQAATRIQGNAPDLRQIQQISDSLKSKVPQAVTNQYNSTINNPFGVPNTGR